MVDISKFFIVSQTQFDNIISFLNCNLSASDDTYVLTYLFVNFMAYIIIFFVLFISLKIYKKLKRVVFSRRL